MLLNNTRYTQPQGPVEVDWGNPLAMGLIVCLLPTAGNKNIAGPGGFSNTLKLSAGATGIRAVTDASTSYALADSTWNRPTEFTALTLVQRLGLVDAFSSPFIKDFQSGGSPSFATWAVEYNQGNAGQDVLTAFSSRSGSFSRTSNYKIS